MEWGHGVKKRQVGVQAQSLVLRTFSPDNSLYYYVFLVLNLRIFQRSFPVSYFAITINYIVFHASHYVPARLRLTFDVVQVSRNRRLLASYFVARVAKY